MYILHRELLVLVSIHLEGLVACKVIVNTMKRGSSGVAIPKIISVRIMLSKRNIIILIKIFSDERI